MNHTFHSRRRLQLHLLLVHQCDLGIDAKSGKDRVVRLSADDAQAKLFGWLKPKREDKCLYLQQPQEDAATDIILGSIVDAVETSVSSQAGERSILSSSSY